MNKILTLAEVLNICAWYEETVKNHQDQLNELPMKVRWSLKRNIEKLLPEIKTWEEFRTPEWEKFRGEWFTEEKTNKVMQNVTDGDGNDVLDENGAVRTQEVLQIKDEYLNDYTVAMNEYNQKMYDVLSETNIYDLKLFDVDEFVESLPDTTSINIEFLDMLSFMDSNNIMKEAE